MNFQGMNDQCLLAEAKNVLLEFQSQNFIKSSSSPNGTPENVNFSFTTLEDIIFTVNLTCKGYQIDETGEIFEAFDALLSQKSKMYIERFQSALFSKLEKLS